MNERRVAFLLLFCLFCLLVALGAGQMLAKRPIYGTYIFLALAFALFMLYRGVNTKGLNLQQGVYYLSFVLINFAVWSPIKSVAYLTPFICLGLFIAANVYVRNARIANRLMVLVLLWGIVSVTYLAIMPNFKMQNSVIAFFTYSSFFVLFIIPSRDLHNPLLLERMCMFLVPLLLLEAVIGLAQGVYGIISIGGIFGPFGDWVEGTLDLHPDPKRSLNNAMFSYNLAMGTLGLVYLQYRRPRASMIILICLCSVCVVVGSVIHLVILFFLGAFISALLTIMSGARQRIGAIMVISSTAIVVFVLIFSLLGKNMSLANRFQDVAYGTNMKILAYTEFWHDSKHEPGRLILGTGPGQYGSRAALIAAGYLGSLPPGFSYTLAEPFKERLLDKWITWFGMWWRSVTNSPGSSSFALLSEAGLVALFALAVWLARFYLGLYARCNRQNLIHCWIISTGVFLVVSSGVADLYWEIPQAIFMGLMLIKAFHANYLPAAQEPHPVPATPSKAKPFAPPAR